MTFRSSRRAVLAAVSLIVLSGCEATMPPPRSAGYPIRSPAGLSSVPLPRPIDRIVVDAGHGGHDPGTQHFGLREKNLTLDISRRLRGELQQSGFNIVMTRETDQFIPLSGRPAIANRIGADLFVSVHANANKSSRVSGIEVYYPRVSAVSAAQWPPGVKPAEVAAASAAVRQVLWDLTLTRARSQSRKLALTICRSMRDRLGSPCRGAKPARFVVLRESWMPSVLVEVGYVSNQAEARKLGDTAYRQAIAESIASGIVAYIRELGAQHI